MRARFLALVLIVLPVLVHAVPVRADEDPHAQAVEMMNELNRLNPFSHASPSPHASGEPLLSDSSIPPELIDKLQYVEKILNNPVTQKYISILENPKVQQDVHALINSSARMALLGWELAWVLFMFIFKAWRLSKSKRLFSVIFTQLWTFALFLTGVFYLVPRFVLGEDFIRFINDVIFVLRH